MDLKHVWSKKNHFGYTPKTMPIFFAALLSGCFKLDADMAVLDTTVIPYEHPSLVVDDAVIRSVDTPLTCPDGEPARIHMVYREDASEPAPAVVVFHSGAFDYVLDHGTSGPLSGPHFHAEPRLTQPFTIRKVWETLGLQIRDIDPAEENRGELTAALANRGVVQYLPGNCWGDLWHNEAGEQENDIEEERFTRNGRALARWTARIATDEAYAENQGVGWPAAIEPEALYAAGLGSGGRGVLELLLDPDSPTVAGALFDSTPDNLAAYRDNPTDFGAEIEGFELIFGTALTDIEALSVAAAPLPDRLFYLWSSSNPQVPAEAMRPGAAAVTGQLGVRVEDTQHPEHVVSNSRPEVAADVIGFLLD